MKRKTRCTDEELRDRSRSAMFDFLEVELEVGNLFAELAKRPCPAEEQCRCIELSSEAYHAVIHFSRRVLLSPREMHRLESALQHLRFTLRELGQLMPVAYHLQNLRSTTRRPKAPSFRQDDSRPLAEIVREFLAQCQRVRADAEWMILQNQRLMRTEHQLRDGTQALPRYRKIRSARHVHEPLPGKTR